ncbi:hypothetical protein CANINC_004521 [Pichia inconspicua]|uniref:Mitochondrial import protein 1 n=1 Tax=Pichia inconspicua TaxID=52247 RepID=A0A4T0WX15_9ASCO|nr:hypothetical protein CANINC_004521 [[Candida] inconspicua]
MSEVGDIVIGTQALENFYEGSEAASADEQEIDVHNANVSVIIDETDNNNSGKEITLVETTSPWSFLVRCGINLVLPFINGMMMGFGEIFAHELCFRSGRQFVGVRVVSQAQRSNFIAANKESVLVRN